MMSDQRNLLLAIVLSLAILLGFQFFVEGPRIAQQQELEAQRQAQLAEEAEQAGTQPAPGSDLEGVAQAPSSGGTATQTGVLTIPGDSAAGGILTRENAIGQTQRITIDTARLHGSINLTGARLDDLTLGDYRETIDPESGEIILLSPLEAPNPYLADFGWVGLTEDTAVPDSTSQWVSQDETLGVDTPVTLQWDNGQGLVFERTVSLDQDYMFTVTQTVTNAGSDTAQLAPYGRIIRYNTPDTLGFFILHEGPYGVFDGTLEEYSYNALQDEDQGVISHESTGGWLGFTDKYWLVSLAPDQEVPFSAQFAHRLVASQDRYYATYRGTDTSLAPGASVSNTLQLFAGAKEVDKIDGYSAHTCNFFTRSLGLCTPTPGIEKFDLTIDFGWFYFLTKPIFYAISAIHNVVGNFGVAILVLTVFVKLLFYPLANKSYQSMSKMKALQPEMTELKERYGDDRQGMQQAMMELYKREKVNPAAGCLPILIQIPVFFALYKVLFVTIEMRHAPFFGWIRDLSQPDPTSIFNLFGLIPIDLPPFLLIGIWPIIMGLTMYAQQKLNPAPTDPMQAKIFLFLPFIFTIMLAGFPAGLVIYWAWNNALSILQQWVIMRRMGVKIGGGVEPSATPGEPAPSVKRKKKAEKAEADPESEGAEEGDEAPEADTEEAAPDLSRARTVKGDKGGRGRKNRRAGKRRS